MEWLSQFLNIEVISFVIPIVAVVSILCVAILKSNQKQKERLKKLNEGFHLEGEE